MLTLLVMAAGMGSRYGSLKQMDGVGPGGEAILDYSVWDAVQAGFGRVVFVIRRDFEQEFRQVFNAERFGGDVAVDYVFQELDALPEGFEVPEGRTKPWGTNHAILMGRGAIDSPFAAINADDFYGRDAFETIARYLRSLHGGVRGHYCMVAYRLENTLSRHGSVSRGICNVDPKGNLAGLAERTKIGWQGEKIVYWDEAGTAFPLEADLPVSMNLFGFTPDYFERSEELFKAFLKERGGESASEFYIPSAVDALIRGGKAQIRVLETRARWFGVTYREDRPLVEQQIRELIAKGEYPERLWG